MAKGRKATAREVDDDGGGPASITAEDVEVGFAKLQGEDFEYYMQTYSIVLGRNSKTSAVDVDLVELGGGMNISRHHARIFYDFTRRRFALEVLGKNGCLVEGVLHVPGTPPVKLDSQDLLQMGDKQFYFLLPTRSIFGGGGGGASVPRQPSGVALARYARRVGSSDRGSLVREDEDDDDDDDDEDDENDAHDDEEEEDEEREVVARVDGKRLLRVSEDEWVEGPGRARTAGPSRRPVTKTERRSRVDTDADDRQLQLLEEKDVITTVATLLSDICGPGKWMSLEKLHAELWEEYGNLWHRSRVRKYLTSEDWPEKEAKGRPWFGLLSLLRKYPERFAVNAQSKGKVTTDIVSLVS
ncbi:FHA domain-containing protein FHA2-like [Canna indica]|uniref:FHA domain-containing protein FHA2-like n=1 Tax=Canna indica TaxID=4628 RepID=A0AAQ3K9T6_9LILI|nr:FHA domain-containing protein FHA2-like [Canna indica]